MSSSHTSTSHAPSAASSSTLNTNTNTNTNTSNAAPDGAVSPGDTSAVYFEDVPEDEKGQRIAALPSGPQQQRPSFTTDRRLSAATQQALFQAYFHALRTGQMPKHNMSPAIAKAEHQANHNRTISDAKKGVTYAGQEQLKRLPIPNLDETCQHYLESVKPFLTPREYLETESVVRDFQERDGPVLQKKLIQYASDKTSYIEQFWYDSYLNFDNPVVLNLNPFFLLEDDPTPARNNQVTRAASLVISALSFIRALRREELPPDNFRGTPLCMYQFTRLFGTARIPTQTGCVMETDIASNHLLVLCRSQMYWFDVLDQNSDVIVTEKDLIANFEAIIEDARSTPVREAAKTAVGVLSTENRRIWAGLREHLLKDSHGQDVPPNRESLQIVDAALFVVCLDDTEPVGAANVAANVLSGSYRLEDGVQTGTCTNRWYDKIQIIVCKNGSAGINFEHTGVDGHTVLRFASDIYTDTILRFARSINAAAPTLWASNSPDPTKRDPESFGDVDTTPHKIEWILTPELATGIRFAETRLSDLILQNEVEVLEFTGYGKNYITAMGLSPDAFVQMAFQAAYYGLYGRVEPTYEPAMTKAFKHGRTEAIFTVSQESVDFVQTFWGDVSPAIKVNALRKACDRHVRTTKLCGQGKGHHRHLYALFCIWERGLESGGNSPEPEHISPRDVMKNGEGATLKDGHLEITIPGLEGRNGPMSPTQSTRSDELPGIYADAAWEKMGNIVMSTSNCGNPSLRLFGFGPVSADGFGLGYIIKDNAVSVCASSKHRQTARFVMLLQDYLNEIKNLLKQTTPRKPRYRPGDVSKTSLRQGRALSVTKLGQSSSEGSDDEDTEMGGYGYFDVGSMAKLIKDQERKADEQTRTGEDVAKARRRAMIGRRLRLAEY